MTVSTQPSDAAQRRKLHRMDEQLRPPDAGREFESAFENAPIGMALLAADSTPLRFNRGFCSMLGYSEPEMLMRSLHDVTHPEDIGRDLRERQLCLAGVKSTYQHEKRYFHQSGRIVWAHLTCSLVRDDDGCPQHFIAHVVDITDRRAAQQQLHDMQAILHVAAEVGRLGGFASERESDRVIWSPEICAIYDVKPGFMPSRSESLQFFLPPDRDAMRERLRHCVREGTPFDAEAQVITAKGRRLWVRVICEAEWDASGVVQRIHGACQDITDAKIAAEQARQIAEQHTMTLESLTDGFFTLDRSYTFTYMNGPAERLMQRPREELLGRRLFDLMPDLRGTDVEEHLAGALRDNRVVQYERDYEPLGIRVHVKIYPSKQGLALFVRDITQVVAAQREIMRLNAELEERVRLRTSELEAANRELESFSYSIAHDLRAPLSSIDGFSFMLERDACDPARKAHYLRRIRAGVRQMGELTDGLLALANLSRTELRRDAVDLAALAHDAVAQLRESMPQRQCTVVIAPSMSAHGDARLLAQVMGNLVGNAWKFTSGTKDARIEVGSYTHTDGSAVYYVRDNGAGFDMAFASRMFEAFQRMHSAGEFEGTGIGLAIVHKIVTRHGGRIWAEGAPGQGATFRFTLLA